MKALHTTAFLWLLLFVGYAVRAQESSDYKTAGIHWLYVWMHEDLVTQYEWSDDSRRFFNGYRVLEQFPESLLDSVKYLAEVLCTQKLHADTEYLYRLSKKGKPIWTTGSVGMLEGMPVNTVGWAAKNATKDYYIRIDVLMNKGGKAIIIGDAKRSKIKPIVTAYIKVRDKDKNMIWKHKVTLKDFSMLRSVKRTRGPITETWSETLGPTDIYMIYEVSMLELFKEE